MILNYNDTKDETINFHIWSSILPSRMIFEGSSGHYNLPNDDWKKNPSVQSQLLSNGNAISRIVIPFYGAVFTPDTIFVGHKMGIFGVNRKTGKTVLDYDSPGGTYFWADSYYTTIETENETFELHCGMFIVQCGQFIVFCNGNSGVIIDIKNPNEILQQTSIERYQKSRQWTGSLYFSRGPVWVTIDSMTYYC